MVSSKHQRMAGEADNEIMTEINSLDFAEDNINISGCHVLPIYDLAVLT